MAELTWDGIGEHEFEIGVDHGVLYPAGGDGVAWNGLVTVTETPSGAESNKKYADNIVYLNIQSAEEFGGTIEAFSSPPEFDQCDGMAELSPGISIGQQGRKSFDFSYRTKVGNDVDGNDGAEKLHLVWSALASPSERAYGTVNESPEPITFSWEFSCTPVPVGTLGGTEYKPTAVLTIRSDRVDADAYADLKEILYGAAGIEPRMPTPAEVYALFEGTVTEVNLVGANAPTYNTGTHVITLPSVTGVVWKINGVTKTAGAQPALTVGQTAVVTAEPSSTAYGLTGDDDWTYTY